MTCSGHKNRYHLFGRALLSAELSSGAVPAAVHMLTADLSLSQNYTPRSRHDV